MVKGSGYITSQCCGSTEIELGTVYAAEMGISLFSDIDRYTLEDAVVTLSYHLQVAGGSYEEVPLGIFEVSEANWKAKCLEIKAYDYMVRFEKTFNGFETVGNAFDFMNLCASACRVELAQTRAEIEAIPAPYAFKDTVYDALVKLCADICKRNGKTKLLWLGDKDKTLNYEPKSGEMVLTVHRWFANKSCPGDWMYARMGDLADKVTAALGSGTDGKGGTTTTQGTQASAFSPLSEADVVKSVGALFTAD